MVGHNLQVDGAVVMCCVWCLLLALFWRHGEHESQRIYQFFVAVEFSNREHIIQMGWGGGRVGYDSASAVGVLNTVDRESLW